MLMIEIRVDGALFHSVWKYQCDEFIDFNSDNILNFMNVKLNKIDGIWRNLMYFQTMKIFKKCWSVDGNERKTKLCCMVMKC